MRELWLIRHGPTHARDMIGWTERPADLSDTACIARLAGLLPLVPVISSDLGRAKATADAIQGARPRLPDDARLREMHFGAWEARTADEAAASHPELSRAFWSGSGDVAAPGGESWNQMAARVCEALDVMPPRAIVVCHFGVILAALQRARGCGVQTIFAQKIDPLSLSEIRLDEETGHWSEGRINHIA